MIADGDSREHDIVDRLDLDIDHIRIAEILDDLQQYDGGENCESSEHDQQPDESEGVKECTGYFERLPVHHTGKTGEIM